MLLEEKDLGHLSNAYQLEVEQVQHVGYMKMEIAAADNMSILLCDNKNVISCTFCLSPSSSNIESQAWRKEIVSTITFITQKIILCRQDNPKFSGGFFK